MADLIYIADDEQDIRNLVKMFLENEGYIVKTFENGDLLFEAFKSQEADLVILDIMMPGTDGLTICNQLRSKSNVPIIMLTAKDSDADYVAGITLGSDDYLIKPFHPVILVMRVKALLRRSKGMQNIVQESVESKDICCGALVLSERKHAVLCEGKEIELTSMEFECLSYMMKHFKEAVSRQDLLNEVWGYDNLVESRVTDETVRRIRKKLSAYKCGVAIANKWGYGYILQEVKSEAN